MAWHTFCGLEEDFIGVTRYVALAPENRATWSEKIAQLLLLTGAAVDSVFNEIRKSSLLPQTTEVIDLAGSSEPNITDYRRVYEPIFQLSSVEVLVSHGLTNYGTIKPFEAFAGNQSPGWWTAYNEVKHEFFQNVQKGTLDNLVRALGGLFVLNILHKDSQQYLIRNSLIWGGNFDRRIVYWRDYENVWEHMKNSHVGVHGNITWDVWVASEIFLHRFRRDPSAKS